MNTAQNSRKDFLRAKETDTETPNDHWEKLIKLKKVCGFLILSNNLLKSKAKTSITGRKLPGNLLKEQDLNVPKVVNKYNKTRTRERTIKKP